MNNIMEFKKYNAVNHDLIVYGNTNSYRTTRKGNHFLNGYDYNPTELIPQMKPLNVNKIETPAAPNFNELFYPETYGVQIEKLPNSYEYDMIIVSNLYGQVAVQTQSTDIDFLDRLYTPIKLYAQNPELIKTDNKVIGCIGFRKVWYPKTPTEYINDIHRGLHPSRASINVCISMCKRPEIYINVYNTAMLNQLENYLLL